MSRSYILFFSWPNQTFFFFWTILKRQCSIVVENAVFRGWWPGFKFLLYLLAVAPWTNNLNSESPSPTCRKQGLRSIPQISWHCQKKKKFKGHPNPCLEYPMAIFFISLISSLHGLPVPSLPLEIESFVPLNLIRLQKQFQQIQDLFRKLILKILFL